jgi:hypothetical protein
MFFVAMKKISDIHDAEEIIQDIFLNLWKRRETVKRQGKLQQIPAIALRISDQFWMCTCEQGKVDRSSAG